ncbi:MAG: sulfatase-like hydrolase/transferase [Proteobacteria bacterium]|nr:sulfatase-like hydrolase/transferase [Pseudomonadota bacterium]
MADPSTGSRSVLRQVIVGNAPAGAARRDRQKRGIGPLFVCLAVAGWILAFDNFAFWRTFAQAQPGTALDQFLAGVGLAALLTLGLAGLVRPLIGNVAGRAIVGLLLVLSAAVAHHIDAWGIVVDRNLIRNIAETDTREVRELLTWLGLADIVLRGVLPAAVLFLVPIRPLSIRRGVAHVGVLFIAAGATATILVTSLYGTLATTFRNHRELRLQLIPSNYINALYGHWKGASPAFTLPATIAPDAVRAAPLSIRPRVLVLMVGETARAANFSLGGYPRPTNRRLDGSEVIYFSRVISCGTDTATSLPCMFSNLGADGFSVSAAGQRENVLDVLMRAGVQVTWLENNSGCKGVCARVPTEVMPVVGPSGLCNDSGCQDEVLVGALQRKLSSIDTDALVVLHLMGSHGPSYFKRYPAPGPFQPTCDTNRIQTCDREALINTYDNTIDYTSKVVADAIRVATDQADRLETAVIYLSDHGESLGERNIYLHGLPKPLAPREQSEVPMIGWVSSRAAAALEVKPTCLRDVSVKPYSHDNLFHTLLGFHGVKTAAYTPSLDIFAIAREGPGCGTRP